MNLKEILDSHGADAFLVSVCDSQIYLSPFVIKTGKESSLCLLISKSSLLKKMLRHPQIRLCCNDSDEAAKGLIKDIMIKIKEMAPWKKKWLRIFI
jgi:hypothetical protein